MNKNKETYEEWSKRELKIMIAILKVFRFLISKFGQFVYTFIIIAGIPILICGSNLFVWTIALITHSVFFFFINDLLTSRELKNEYYQELTDEIKIIRGSLKEKS